MAEPPLPGTLAPIAELVGVEAALRLVARCGGTRQRIPAEPERSACQLVQALGPAAARRLLSRYHPGGHIDVPVMSSWLAELRRRRVLELKGAGRPISEIARTLGLTERGVYKILARDPLGIDAAQLDLFRPEPVQV